MKKVSVFMVTYNHGKYVAAAIESVISQKVNFDFELVIGEDCSKDDTRAICEQYAARYPGIIRLLPSLERNMGAMANDRRVLEACTGEYIAMCEGDDYWTDNNKLQKQVDFLDAHPDYSMCFSAVTIVDELNWNAPDDLFYPKLTKDTYTIEDFILSPVSIVPTATLVFRNLLKKPLPPFWESAGGADMMLHLILADKGKAKYMNEKTAVYRNHSGGITKSEFMQRAENKEPVLKKTFENMNKYLNYKYDKIFRERFFQMSKTLLIYGSREKHGLEKLKHYFKYIRDYVKYSKKINYKELAYYHLILFAPGILKLFKSK